MLILGRKIGTSILLEVLDVKLMLTINNIESYQTSLSISAPDLNLNATLGQHEFIVVSVDHIKIRIEVAYYKFEEVILAFDCPQEVAIVRTDALAKESVKEGKKHAAAV